MDVIIALEWVSVHGALDLDHGVVQVILAAAKVSHLLQGLEGVLGNDDVHGHCVLAHADGPNVQVVHVSDREALGRIKGPDVVEETLRVKPVWSTLHKDADALTSDGCCRAQDNDCEDVSADRITHPGLRLEVDDRCRDNDAHRHNAVADDVEHRRVHIEITTEFCLFGRWCRLSNLPLDSLTFSRCLGGLNPLRLGAARDGLVVALFRLMCVNVRHHFVVLVLTIVAVVVPVRMTVVVPMRMTVVMAMRVTVIVPMRVTVIVPMRVTVRMTVVVIVPAKVVVTFPRV